MVRTNVPELSAVGTVRTKKCSGAHGCGEIKPVSEFYIMRQNADGTPGYDSYCKTCRADYSRNQNALYGNVNKVRRRENHLLKKYSLTQTEYADMLLSQQGVCAICGNPETLLDRNLAVDHNHVTGEVRSLLCYRCNRAIGSFEDNSDLLFSAALYLLAHTSVEE